MERIDIVIADQIDESIGTKIALIGKAALMANEEIEKLKRTLSDIGVAKLNDLVRATGQLAINSEKLAAAQAKTSLATARANTEAAKQASLMSGSFASSIVSLSKANTEQEKAGLVAARSATEQARLAGVYSRNSVAATQAELANMRLARSHDELDQASQRSHRSIIQWIASVAGGIVVYQGIRLAIGGVINMIGAAVTATDNFAVSTTQMAATLTTLAKDKNDPFATFQHNLEYAKGLVPVLMDVDKYTTLNMDHLLVINQELNKQGMYIRNNNAEDKDFLTNLSNAVALYSLSLIHI